MSNPKGNPNWKKGGPSPNPSGMPPLTADQREARRILDAATPGAAKVVVELTKSADEKIALAAAKIILDKAVPDKLDGDALNHNPFAGLSVADLLALARGDK